MPNIRGGIRRRAISSRLYGITELSRPTAKPSSSTLGWSSLAACVERPPAGASTKAPTRLAIAKPRDARPAPAGLRAEQDVTTPSRRRPAARTATPSGRGGPGRARAAPPRAPPARPRSGRASRRDPMTAMVKRPEELDGDRDAEGDPGEGLVERPVHAPSGPTPNASATSQSRPLRPRNAGPGDQQQDDRRGDQPQPDHCGRRHLSKRFLAIAAPNWTEKMPTNTSQTAGIRDRGFRRSHENGVGRTTARLVGERRGSVSARLVFR